MSTIYLYAHYTKKTHTDNSETQFLNPIWNDKLTWQIGGEVKGLEVSDQ